MFREARAAAVEVKEREPYIVRDEMTTHGLSRWSHTGESKCAKTEEDGQQPYREEFRDGYVGLRPTAEVLDNVEAMTLDDVDCVLCKLMFESTVAKEHT